MPYIAYQNWNPQTHTRAIINYANQIAADYGAQGYSLTLRQLYYRFIAADLLPNTQASYNKLGSIINKARLAGMIDWNHIDDRTRVHQAPTTWETPTQILEAAMNGYAEDLWANQPARPEVWVEKDALVDVIGQAADKRDVPYFSCRGYTSQSAMWRAGQRMIEHLVGGQRPWIIHLGDHDPSGIDMTRDIFDRLHTFIGTDPRVWEKAEEAGHESPYEWGTSGEVPDFDHSFQDTFTSTPFFTVSRIALNYDQVEEYNPPPNPAKLTDSRAREYVFNHGYQSWELDALEPQVLDRLIVREIDRVRDPELWDEALRSQERSREKIRDAISTVE